MTKSLPEDWCSRSGIETQAIEFKASTSDRKTAFAQLCGMVNTERARGCLVFGIGPDGSIVGLRGNIDEIQRNLINHARQSFEPAVGLDVDSHTFGDSTSILRIQSQRALETSFHEYLGCAFIREGTTNRRMTLNEKRDRLIRSEVSLAACRLNAELARLDLQIIEVVDPVRLGVAPQAQSLDIMNAMEQRIEALEAEFQHAPLARKATLGSALRSLYLTWLERARHNFGHGGRYSAIRARVEEGLAGIASFDHYEEFQAGAARGQGEVSAASAAARSTPAPLIP